ncbi:ATP-binding cassette domain-containing protein [Alicyclobacillus fodiniaquatilis]|uniref:ATP-binding cassette domain-containing protein n=1 Tax=Alicyclobacillus fodiniaquatilis TaxID=1661150 RepID=A0ABW4JJP8_9BACL
MLLELDDIHVQTQSNTRLTAVSTTVSEGEYLLIVGRNGAGKSSLLDVMNGLLRPTSGTVRVNGQVLWGGRHSRGDRHQIGYLDQSAEFSLFAGTVVEEFAFTYGVKPHQLMQDLTPVQAALAAVGLDDVDVTSSPAEWSLGMQRRFALALILASPLACLMLDEPTAGLDACSEQALLRQIDQVYQSGRTVVIASHDLDTFLPRATRVWVVEEGQIVFDGPAATFREHPSVWANRHVPTPASLRLCQALTASGLPLALTSSPAPEDLARQLAQIQREHGSNSMTPTKVTSTQTKEEVEQTTSTPERKKRANGPDPRARWLGVTCITISLALTSGARAAELGVAATIFFLILFRASLRRVGQWTIVWAIFATMTTLFSAGQLGYPFQPQQAYGIQFEVARATLVQLLPYWCFLQIGQLLVSRTTALQVHSMVAWVLRSLRLPPRVCHGAGLLAGMIFRFIPAIGAMYQAQLRAYHVRTHRLQKSWGATFRVNAVLAPLMIRLIHFGETTTDAMQARRIFATPLNLRAILNERLTLRDWLTGGLGVSLALLILIAARFG